MCLYITISRFHTYIYIYLYLYPAYRSQTSIVPFAQALQRRPGSAASRRGDRGGGGRGAGAAEALPGGALLCLRPRGITTFGKCISYI